MATYSFMDVTASLSGPTGEIDLGYGSASSEEGITVAMGGPKNTMTIGADGEVMHSLHADKSGTVTVNLLKTSPTNKKLSLAYNAQSQSSGTWGNNVIVIRNKVSGDIITARSTQDEGFEWGRITHFMPLPLEIAVGLSVPLVILVMAFVVRRIQRAHGEH